MKISQIADKILNTAQQISFTQYLFETFWLLPISAFFEGYKFAWLIWLLNFLDDRESESNVFNHDWSRLVTFCRQIFEKTWKKLRSIMIILEFLEGDSLTRKSDAQNKILVISAKHNFRHPTETSLSVHTVGTCSQFHW